MTRVLLSKNKRGVCFRGGSLKEQRRLVAQSTTILKSTPNIEYYAQFGLIRWTFGGQQGIFVPVDLNKLLSDTFFLQSLSPASTIWWPLTIYCPIPELTH